MAINNVNVGIANTDLVTVPTDQKYAITTILVCNTYVVNPSDKNEGKTSFDLHVVKNADTVSNKNKIVSQLELTASETFTFDTEKLILDAGDKVVINGESPTNLSCTISWLEV